MNLLIKTAIRTLFTFTSREKALEKSELVLRQYGKLADGLSSEAGQRCIEVPPMRGVDEDMRKWSFFMILEHNAIVNRSITATVVQLARGQELRKRGQSHTFTYFQESLISGCRSVCENSGCFNNSLLCVPAALREDLLIRRRFRA